MQAERLQLLVGGEWKESQSQDVRPTFNPAEGKAIAGVPFSTRDEVRAAVDSGAERFESWKNVPILERVQYLFRMKQVLESEAEKLAVLNTQNHGKTLEESRGDLKRTIENVDSAIAVAYTLAKGSTLDQISPGVDVSMSKEPLGVFSIVCPFNFPLMIPFWFIPYAVVLGDTVVVKPSEVTPLPMQRVAHLLQEEVKLPAGVFNMVHGGADVVEALISEPSVKGVTFVGSTPVARRVFELAGKQGKRSIVNGGAKNSVVVTPAADLDASVPAIVSSFFGNSGQRCLAGANLVAVGESEDGILPRFARASSGLRVGDGLEPGTQMGPVVSKAAKERISGYVEKGLDEGARLVADGREARVAEHPDGFYLGATVFSGVTPEMKIAKDEIFGPVASVLRVGSLDEAIEQINHATPYGNMASIFTTSGREAREFRRRVNAGNVGINVGVPAPSGYFPFGGMRDSFFGTLHPQIDSVDFFTDRKVTISRW
ncbi:MAG TPA: CoA-acylating methylmalonate-semialdehyde dehydrogenase [Nitrososphaerales archaeon]|nr:CoA-acylating methylmalonate-semialdehyde dehydrogenase [Nitrososphaerales archaeon]